MLSTRFNYIYEQRNLRFPSILDQWRFQNGHQIAVSTDAEFADNKYCLNLVVLWIFKFLLLH